MSVQLKPKHGCATQGKISLLKTIQNMVVQDKIKMAGQHKTKHGCSTQDKNITVQHKANHGCATQDKTWLCST